MSIFSDIQSSHACLAHSKLCRILLTYDHILRNRAYGTVFCANSHIAHLFANEPRSCLCRKTVHMLHTLAIDIHPGLSSYLLLLLSSSLFSGGSGSLPGWFTDKSVQEQWPVCIGGAPCLYDFCVASREKAEASNSVSCLYESDLEA